MLVCCRQANGRKDVPRFLNHGARCDGPALNGALCAGVKGLDELAHDGALAAPFVTLGDGRLIAVVEELVRPLDAVVALLDEVDDGDGIRQIPGRCYLHPSQRPMRWTAA